MNDFGPGTPANFVWILAYSRAALNRANTALFEAAGEETAGGPPPVPLALGFDFADTAFVSPVAAEKAKLLAHSPGMCAAILVIEREALADPAYVGWATWCCREVARRDDFRLFVRLDGIEMSEVVERSRSEGFLADLRDVVQITETLEKDQLPRELAKYLADIGAIRDRARWRAAKTELATAAGGFAALIQTAAGAAMIALGVSVLTGVEATRVAAIPKDIGGLICGMPLFPLATIVCFFLSRGRRMANVLMAENASLNRMLFGAILGCTLSLYVDSTLGFSTSGLVLGMALGVLLDAVRRTGRQALRAKVVLDGCAATPHHLNLPWRVEMASRGSGPHPLRCPLFPPDPPRIFISYARASEWCRGKAKELYDALHGRGVAVFLDREGIPEGGNWRRRLNLKLAEASVVMCLADELSVEREWVAAEVETALDGLHRTGLPEIIALVHADVTRPPPSTAYPAFRALLSEQSTVQRPGEPRRITVKDTTVATVASQFDQHSSAGGAVFPPHLTWLLRALVRPVTVVGVFGQGPGKLAGLLSVLQWTGLFVVTTRLESAGLLGPITLLFAYWMGFTLSLALAARYEVQADDDARRASVASHNLAVIGFACWLGMASPKLAPLWWGWSTVCAGLGWYLGWDFVRVVAMVRADFRARDV